MGQEQRRVAKAQLVAGMQAGYSWQTAAAQAGLQTSQSNAYRLMKAFRQAPQTPSSTIQAALQERFEPPREYQPDQPCASSTWG